MEIDFLIKVGILVITFIVAIIITVIVIKAIRNANKKHTRVFNSKYHSLDDKERGAAIVPSKRLPSSSNGHDQTYDLWLYLADNFEVTSGYKIVFIRESVEQNSGYVSKDAGPIVCLDKATNKLLVAIATTALKKSYYSLDEVFSPSGSNPGFLVAYIDVIPLQTWSQVTIMIKDNELRLYLDADVYSVSNTYELPSSSMIKSNEGNIYVGDPVHIARGYIANFRYYNHVINQKSLKRNYKEGPLKKNWLKWFGIQQYGVRSPVYRV